MIYIASNLLAQLKHLILTGQNEEKELEFTATEKSWCDYETELLQREDNQQLLWK